MPDNHPGVGEPAPSFALMDGDGREVTVPEDDDKVTILYFYPKDDTAGCTKEACGFRDLNADIQAAGARVLGVSADDVESHRNFANKYNLNFPLLADEGAAVSQAYGVWGEKEIRGRTITGITRTTFAIDEEGKVANVWEVQDPEAHSKEVLDWLKSR